MQYRPFISHQWADKSVVRKIAEQLIDVGMDPIFDIWDFVPGDSLTESMRDGIASATSFVLFWSRNSASSDNVEYEYERELGLVELKKRDDFRVICVLLDNTPPPAEHSFRLYIDWQKGRRNGKTFNANLTRLIRAIRGMSIEEKPVAGIQHRTVPSSDPIIKQLVDKILQGRNIVVAYKCPYRRNPLSGTTIPTTTFFEELVATAKASQNIAVIDYDESKMGDSFTYIPSYRLVEVAAEVPEFGVFKEKLQRAFDAYHTPYKTDMNKRHNPWQTEGGARFLADISRNVGIPVLAILRNVHLELEGYHEPQFVYGNEIPVLSAGLSVVFDIWQEENWEIISDLIDFAVEEMDGERKLFEGSRIMQPVWPLPS